MNITTIFEHEIERLIEIQKKSFPLHLCEEQNVFENRFRHFGEYFRCAREDKTILAYMIAFPFKLGEIPENNKPFSLPFPTFDTLFIHDITVDPCARGKGIPKLLIGSAEEMAQQNKYKHICLVAVGQSGNYWDKLGFKEVSNLQDNVRLKLKSSYDDLSRLMFKDI